MNDQVQEQVPPAAAAEIASETISMLDGRKVEFAGSPTSDRRRKMLKDTVFDDNGHPTVRFDFRNGETRHFRIPESLVLRLAGHGAEQKIGDAAAGEKDVDDMILAIESVMDRLSKGEWNVAREGGGFGGTSVLMRALAELSGKPIEEVKEKVKSMSPKEKVLLRTHAKVAPIIQRLEAEKAAKDAHVDPDALLAGFA